MQLSLIRVSYHTKNAYTYFPKPKRVFLSMQNTDRNGNILRPDVTSLIVKCNSIPDMLTTTANTFTFTNASCVGATEATIEVTATNVVNSSSVMDIISPSKFRLPQDIGTCTIHAL